MLDRAIEVARDPRTNCRPNERVKASQAPINIMDMEDSPVVFPEEPSSTGGTQDIGQRSGGNHHLVPKARGR